MDSTTHKRWLYVTAAVIGSLAPVFALGSHAATAEPARFALDLASFPLDRRTTFDHPDTHFLSALSGGFLAGWGVTVFCLARSVYDQAPEAVRRAVLAGAATWFVFDSAGSIASGNASNALFNVVFLALAVGPLAFAAKRPAVG